MRLVYTMRIDDGFICINVIMRALSYSCATGIFFFFYSLRVCDLHISTKFGTIICNVVDKSIFAVFFFLALGGLSFF